jgi:hypothetical protein
LHKVALPEETLKKEAGIFSYAGLFQLIHLEIFFAAVKKRRMRRASMRKRRALR